MYRTATDLTRSSAEQSIRKRQVRDIRGSVGYKVVELRRFFATQLYLFKLPADLRMGVDWLPSALSPQNGLSAAETLALLTTDPAARRPEPVLRRLAASDALMRSAGVGGPARLQTAVAAVARGRLFRRVEQAITVVAENALRRELPIVSQALDQSRRLGGYDTADQFTRMWELWLLLQRFRPHICWEFGTGTTTAVLASYCDAGQHVTSVEESPEWHAQQKQFLATFGDRCRLLLVDSVVTEIEEMPVVHYALEHDFDADFVYVDGPQNTIPQRLNERQRARAASVDGKGRLASANIELMWRNGRFPRFVAVDGRSITVKRLAAMPQADRYAFFPSALYRYVAEARIPNSYLFHTVLVRRD